MRFSALLIVAGLLALVFGLAFFFAPVEALNLYGAATGPVGYLMTRFFGVALIQTGLVYLLIRNVIEPAVIKGIAIGSALGSLAGLRVALFAERNSLVSAVGWSTVAIYALLLLGYAWFVFKGAKAS